MSLILEALRRSEAERRRGKAPGLFVEQQVLARRRRRLPTWAPWVAGALALAVIAGWVGRESASGEAEPVASAPAAAPVSTPAAPAVTAPTSAPASAPTSARTSAPVASVAVGAPPAPSAVEVTPAPATVDASPSPATATPAPVPPPTAPVEAPVAAAPIDVPSAPAAETPPAPPVADDTALPGLAALSAGERAALPPLKLSMHVYSDDPARRFVIVDGKRLTEGATPAPGVVVETIRRDGAVLAVNGRRVLLSRP